MDKDINDLLSRGVGEFVDPDGTFRKKLETSPEKIFIKFGIDPTRPDIHLGHAVILHKLRKFQDLGCNIVFLIGDYTAVIGDPSGKSKIRPEISFSEVKTNADTYLAQVGKILDVSNKDKYKVLWNSIWYQSATDYPSGNMVEKSMMWEKDRKEYRSIRGALPTITLWNFLFTLRGVTHAQLVERDMFQKRIKSGENLYMHEMMYPLLQGTDSWAIAGFFGSCDLEVGGTDQTFNMLMGRSVMKSNTQEPQSILSFKLLEGLDGKEKMSKSLDNYVSITDKPNDMYGKIMSIPDSSIGNYFELCTFTPMDEVVSILKGLNDNSLHPKEVKLSLAKQIVAIYHGEDLAKKAEENFTETFSKGGVPKEVETVVVETNAKLSDVVLSAGVVESKTEWRRLLEDGAVTKVETGEKIKSPDEIVSGDFTLKVGKHRFIRIEAR